MLVRALTESYLAWVAGPVAWGFEVGSFTVRHHPDFIAVRPDDTVTAAAVLQPTPGTWQVVPLRARTLTHLSWTGRTGPSPTASSPSGFAIPPKAPSATRPPSRLARGSASG